MNLKLLRDKLRYLIIQKFKDDQRVLLNKIENAKMLKKKKKDKIEENHKIIEDTKDELNIIKINVCLMEEGIDID